LITSNEEGCEFSSSITVIFDFSHCSGINEEPRQEGLRVIPNPNQGTFHISIEGDKDIFSVRIFDVTGREVFSREPLQGKDTAIDLGDAAHGIFVISAETSGKRIYRRLIVVR
jgi:hypothetical protein